MYLEFKLTTDRVNNTHYQVCTELDKVIQVNDIILKPKLNTMMAIIKMQW